MGKKLSNAKHYPEPTKKRYKSYFVFSVHFFCEAIVEKSNVCKKIRMFLKKFESFVGIRTMFMKIASG